MVFMMVLELNLFQSLNVNAKVIDPYHWKFSSMRLTDICHTWLSIREIHFDSTFFDFSSTFLKVGIFALNKPAGIRQFEEAVSALTRLTDHTDYLILDRTGTKMILFFISGPIILLR